MGLLIAIFIVVISASQAAAKCPPGEYETNGLCCPMCHLGTVVKSHCTAESSSSVCIPCVEGTYMDHPNGLTECFKCKACDIGAGLVEKKSCTYTSNTECECKPRYYCADSSCDLCQEHKVCSPGQYVKVRGTPTRDNECEECPPGHFSAANMSETCTAWTECAESGRILTEKGTSISDSVCVDRRKHFVIFVSLITFLILSVSVLTLNYSKNVPMSPEKQHTARDLEESHKSPIQESDHLNPG